MQLVDQFNSMIADYINKAGKKIKPLVNNTIISLCIISFIAIFIRLYLLTPEIPLTLDALGYFWYANDMSLLGYIPAYGRDNNGWPMFLSVFFSIFHSSDFLQYMLVQRITTVVISIITIIPVYLLCSRIFKKSYALIGSALFVFDPRIIENSLLGITDPLFILLVTIALAFSLDNRKKLVYISFGISALSCIVRAEGLFLFIALSMIFLIRYRKEKKIVIKYLIGLSIFILLISPVVIIRTHEIGRDGLTSQITSNIQYNLSESEHQEDKSNLIIYFIKGIENPIKFLGWSMIPIFIFFIPYGIFQTFRNRNQSTKSIIIAIIIMIIPAFYALSRFSDSRYLFPIYPLLCVVSLFTIKALVEKSKKKNIVLFLLICYVLISSCVFLHFKGVDREHEKESLSLAYYVDNMTSGINPYAPESKYLPIPEISKQNFPILSTAVSTGPKIIPTDGFLTIDKYITKNKDKGLTNLVLDGSNNNPGFLNDAFFHEEKYPYLEKIFDSTEHGYKYHLKIFKINYSKFESLKTN